MTRWLPSELHSHTVHSDGEMIPEQLADLGRGCGFGAMALTDHNTTTGFPAFARSALKRGMIALPGIELTTFYGHALMLGEGPYPDWRSFGPSDLRDVLRTWEGRESCAVGAAHPFHPGTPFCTGCYWEYELPLGELDYLEVWSGRDAAFRAYNRRAYSLWTRLLSEGLRVTAASGRDWHKAEAEAENEASRERLSTTYLGLRGEEGWEACVAALKAGRAVVSTGPLVTLYLRDAEIGDEARARDPDEALLITVEDTGWGVELARIGDPSLIVTSDVGLLGELRLAKGNSTLSFPFSGEARRWRWIRAELFGELDRGSQLIAFTNALYREGAGSRAI